MITDLMKPRYKVMIKVPLSRHKVGDIIYGDGDWYSTHRSQVDVLCSAYPDVYRKLHWWEDRKVEEMPEYVKSNNGVFNVEWVVRNGDFYLSDATDKNDPWIRPTDKIIPATLEEYQQYTQSKTTHP